MNLKQALVHVYKIKLRQAKCLIKTSKDYQVANAGICKEFATHKTFVELENKLKMDAERCAKKVEKIHKRYLENRAVLRRR